MGPGQALAAAMTAGRTVQVLALFDENAGCHVAWGQSFPFAVAGGTGKSENELSGIGLNSSMVHTDVVIGGAGLTVTGTGPGGTVEIIRDDAWVLGATPR
jgi:aminopeptidase